MYTIVKNFLTHEQCDSLIKRFETSTEIGVRSRIRGKLANFHPKEKEPTPVLYDKHLLIAHCYDIPFDDPITSLTWSYIKYFSSHHNFNITHQEGFIVHKYAKNGHFAWHTDGSTYSNPPPWSSSNPEMRIGISETKYDKLSVTIQLSASTDYEGGELQFGQDSEGKTERPVTETYDDLKKWKKSINAITTISQDKGTLCIFNGFSYHRVTPITKGTRYSLLNFYQGQK
jgi:PKHD-type hydroxylase